MNVEIRTESAQFPEKENINGIFVAVRVAKSNTEEAFHHLNPSKFPNKRENLSLDIFYQVAS